MGVLSGAEATDSHALAGTSAMSCAHGEMENVQFGWNDFRLVCFACQTEYCPKVERFSLNELRNACSSLLK